jgi:hypothetical protein
MLHLPAIEFRDAYLGKLDRIGIEVIVSRARAIAEQATTACACSASAPTAPAAIAGSLPSG